MIKPWKFKYKILYSQNGENNFMKINKLITTFTVIIGLIFCTNVFYVLAKAVTSSDLDFVGEPTYILYRQESRRYYYNITVTIKNLGYESSDSVDIKIVEDGNTICPDDCNDIVFLPREEKTFTLNWATSSPKKNIDIIWVTKYNNGSKTIEISANPDDKKDTPGFEFMTALLSIIVILLFFKKYKKF